MSISCRLLLHSGPMPAHCHACFPNLCVVQCNFCTVSPYHDMLLAHEHQSLFRFVMTCFAMQLMPHKCCSMTCYLQIPYKARIPTIACIVLQLTGELPFVPTSSWRKPKAPECVLPQGKQTWASLEATLQHHINYVSTAALCGHEWFVLHMPYSGVA